MAPKGTPQSIVDRLQGEIAAMLAKGSLRDRLIELGAERIVNNTPAEAKAYVTAEIDRWGGILRDAGIQPQ